MAPYRIVDSNNTEVVISEHPRLNGSASVAIYADSPMLIQGVIQFLDKLWTQVTFTVPAEDATGRWAVMGHVGPKKSSNIPYEARMGDTHSRHF